MMHGLPMPTARLVYPAQPLCREFPHPLAIEQSPAGLFLAGMFEWLISRVENASAVWKSSEHPTLPSRTPDAKKSSSKVFCFPALGMCLHQTLRSRHAP